VQARPPGEWRRQRGSRREGRNDQRERREGGSTAEPVSLAKIGIFTGEGHDDNGSHDPCEHGEGERLHGYPTGEPLSGLRGKVDAMAIAQETLQALQRAGLAEIDPETAGLIERELERQRGQIELIASENFTWPSVLEAVGSVPTNKYAEGYPGRRYYGGCEVVDEIERLAVDRAKELFAAEHANVQPHAGAQTNMAVYFSCLEPGDTVLAMRLDHGGHLTHGLKVNFSGKLYNFIGYGVDRETYRIDFDEVLTAAKECRPKLIVCGGSAYPRRIEADRFREIADEVGALLLCDMAHFAGLVAAGLHPNPTPHCDFVTSTTHKTLAGPRSGFVLCKEEHAQALDKAVFPGMQGGPLEHVIAAKAACFKVAGSQAFRDYQSQVRANADALADALMGNGLDVLTGGTDTHLLQMDLRGSDWSGRAAEERLHEVKITANRNTVPFDERPPMEASGVRLGTPAVTMRGFDEADLGDVGEIIAGALAEDADVEALAARSTALCDKHRLYPGFRGYTTYES
jgi:glycine hydroxymethyltransferase